MDIETGLIRDSSLEGHVVRFAIRPLSASDFDNVQVLQAEVAERLGSNYIPSSPENVGTALNQGFSLGLFVQDRLEGIRLVYDRRPLSDAIREALALAIEEEHDVAHLFGIYVRSPFAGNKLGRRMTEHAIRMLRHRGRKHVYSTVAPANYQSLRNLFELDFVVLSPLVMNGGARRLVLYTQLQEMKAFSGGSPALVSTADLEAQQRMAKERWVAVNVVRREGEDLLEYRPFVKNSRGGP